MNTTFSYHGSRSSYSRIEELVGARVTALFVNDDQSRLFIETDRGNYVLVTDADCCSETWFADILGVDALLGHTVASAYEVDIDKKDDGRTRQEYDQFYGFRLTTERGVCDIVYRNSSNGYYGGSATLHEDPERPPTLRAILDDWSA